VRLNIFPDGGVSRFHVYGVPSPDARRAAVLRQLNAVDTPEVRALLADFCAAPAWIDRVSASRPFASAKSLVDAADAAFADVDREGWLEAFRHHPRIGERAAERAQSASAAKASAIEQTAVSDAAAADREALAQANREYEQRFGHVFIIAAAGRSASDILQALRARMNNDPDTELRAAAEEHQKITRLRLERVVA
jgi:allantoicase